jgi:hypothetical protein
MARLEQRSTARDDGHLEARVRYLNEKYFQGSLTWESITYFTRQEKRRGSCTYYKKTIRISHRLSRMPQWVEDYVIIHELAHLLEPNHGKHYQASWSRSYPLGKRAIGFLMAMAILGELELLDGADTGNSSVTILSCNPVCSPKRIPKLFAFRREYF